MAGIRTLRCLHYPPETNDGLAGDLAIIELTKDVAAGLRPLTPAWDYSPASRLTCWGYGGGNSGLLEAHDCTAVSAQGMLVLEGDPNLGQRDSGAPLLVERDDGGLEVAGVFVGTRATATEEAQPNGNGSTASQPRFARLAIALSSHRRWLETLIKERGSDQVEGEMAAVLLRFDELPMRCAEPCAQTRDAIPDYAIGRGEIHRHAFTIGEGEATELVVAVNTSLMPLRSRPRIVMRLFYKATLVGLRAYPGPFQVLMVPFRKGKGDDGPGERGLPAGQWHVEVESESEIRYQIAVTRFTEAVRRRRRRATSTKALALPDLSRRAS